jgi:hypothetical protein
MIKAHMGCCRGSKRDGRRQRGQNDSVSHSLKGRCMSSTGTPVIPVDIAQDFPSANAAKWESHAVMGRGLQDFTREWTKVRMMSYFAVVQGEQRGDFEY